MTSRENCLGYLWLKGVDGDLKNSIPEWSCCLSLLRDQRLIYFTIDPKTPAKGKIALDQAQIEVSTGPVPGALYAHADCFRCVTPNRTYHIYADNSENRNKWVNILSEHVKKLRASGSDNISKGKQDESFELREQISTATQVEFLTKSGGVSNLSWKKRLFVLNGKNFVYYELPQGIQGRGNFSCTSCQSYHDPSENFPEKLTTDTCIQVETEKGTLLILALSISDKNGWMEAIGKAVTAPPTTPSEKSTVDATQLLQQTKEMQARVNELTATKVSNEETVRSLKSETKKLEQEIETLNARIRQLDEEDAAKHKELSQLQMDIYALTQSS